MTSENSDASYHVRPLRVGILAPSFVEPRWIRRVVESIIESPQTTLAVFAVIDSPPRSAHRRGYDLRLFLFSIYTRLDRLFFSVTRDAFEQANLRPLLGDTSVLSMRPVQEQQAVRFSKKDVATLDSYQLDVVMSFAPDLLTKAVQGSARYGAWTHFHGSQNAAFPCFWEVITHQPVTTSGLFMHTSQSDETRVLCQSYAHTYRFSFNQNRNPVYWKTAEFAIRKLEELHERGPAALAGTPSRSDCAVDNGQPDKTPTNGRMLIALPGMLVRIARRAIALLFTVERWSVGVCPSVEEDRLGADLTSAQQLGSPGSCYWADPFVVSENDGHYVFVEEFPLTTKRGHISVVELDTEGRPQGHYPVLKRDYHLSYPCVFQWNKHYYMIPESSANRTVDLFRCTEFPREWKLEKTLLHDISALDATVFEFDGHWWMFFTTDEHSVWGDELLLYHAHTPLGPWEPHRRNPVKSDVRSSRPAGQVFRSGDDYYRPAQDCSKDYGYAISVNRIDQLDLTCYRETEVSNILPEWSCGIRGTHTLNHTHGLTVFDQKRVVFRRPF